MDPLHKKVIFRTLGFFFMWCLSSWFFVLVEHTEESDVEVKRKILQSTFDSMASKYNMSIQDFNNFSNKAYEALSEPKRQWTYNVAMRFVFQALTTIGYGYITPQTPQGQLMCILVAVPGIPITILAFQAIGEMIARWVNNIVDKIERKILKREEPRGMQTKSLMFLVSLTLALIAVNGSVMMDPYEWTFVEAVYFWFVTLTTIGFGDYTMVRSQRIMELSINISQNHDEGKDEAEQKTFEIFTGLFFLFDLILCLCIVSSVLNSVVSFIEENKFRAPCPGCVSRRTQDQVDNETNNISSNFGFQREENAMSMTSVEL